MAAPLGPASVLGELRWELSGMNRRLDEYAARFHLNLADAVRQTAFALELKIKQRTPVDTGRARNSWHVVTWSAGAPGSSAYAYKDNRGNVFDGTTSAVPERDTQAIVASNVVYMLALEAGWSKQAPAGMVRVSVAEARRHFVERVRLAKEKTKA